MPHLRQPKNPHKHAISCRLLKFGLLSDISFGTHSCKTKLQRPVKGSRQDHQKSLALLPCCCCPACRHSCQVASLAGGIYLQPQNLSGHRIGHFILQQVLFFFALVFVLGNNNLAWPQLFDTAFSEKDKTRFFSFKGPSADSPDVFRVLHSLGI